MTTEVVVYPEEVEFEFDPSPDNQANPEPRYDEDLKLGVISSGGRAILATFLPGTEMKDARAHVKDVGTHAEVIVGTGISTSKRSNGTRKVLVKHQTAKWIIQNETQTIPIGTAEVEITHRSA